MCKIKFARVNLKRDYPTLLRLRKRVQHRRLRRNPPPPPPTGPDFSKNPVLKYLHKDEWEARVAKAKQDREEEERQEIIAGGVLTAEGVDLQRRLQEDLDLFIDDNSNTIAAGELVFESGTLGRGVLVGDLMEVLTEGMYCAQGNDAGKRGAVRVYDGPTTTASVMAVLRQVTSKCTSSKISSQSRFNATVLTCFLSGRTGACNR